MKVQGVATLKSGCGVKVAYLEIPDEELKFIPPEDRAEYIRKKVQEHMQQYITYNWYVA